MRQRNSSRTDILSDIFFTPPLPASVSDPQLEILPVTLRSFHMPQEQLRRLRDFCRDNRQVYRKDWFR
jgi:hypothetical protein